MTAMKRLPDHARPALLLVLFASLGFAGPALAAVELQKIGDSAVDPAALNLGDPKYPGSKFDGFINGCVGQQEAVFTHKGFQYVGYYDADRHVCIARRELPGGDWEVARLEDYLFKSNDGHNYISIGVCPGDGTIHVAFDHHNHPLHYRVSRKGVADHPEQTKWDASLFGPVRSELVDKKPLRITYPAFLPTPDGRLQFLYRTGASGGGDWAMNDYDPPTGRWSDARLFHVRQGTFTDRYGTSDGRCSYPNRYIYDSKGRLHVTWVWRENGRSSSSNHDLMYAYSDDQGKTWMNDAGEAINGPARVDTPGITVLHIPRNGGLANGNAHAVDSEGRVHVILRHHLDVAPGQEQTATTVKASDRPPSGYFHYWRKAPGRWVMNKLPGPGVTRGRLFIDKADNAFMITQIGGDLVIMAATADKQWTDWRVVQTQKGPFNNEMVGDSPRWQSEGVLSVMVQESPASKASPSRLRIIDFRLK